MNGTPSDHELMAGLARGEVTSVRGLFDRYSPTLLALADRVVRDRHEAEEVVNEVFLELWQHAGRFDENRGSPRGYLMLLTRSRAIDRVRSRNGGGRHKERNLHPHAPEPEAGGVAVSPADRAEMAELRHVVRHAMQALPEDVRGPVALSFFNGLTHEQIAQATGQPLGTVKGRIRRGLIKLRDDLRHHFESDKADGVVKSSPASPARGNGAGKHGPTNGGTP